ncbi:hypothetical protein D3C81_1525660 [compost metagenome]
MLPELLTKMPIHAQVMKEVIPLKHPVLLDHPQIFGTDERLEYRSGNVRMVVRTQGVADVMQQGTNHIFLVAPVTKGTGGGLQRVGQAIHREAAEIAFQQFQVGHDPCGQLFGVGAEVGGDDRPIFLGTVLHMGEAGIGIHWLTLIQNATRPRIMSRYMTKSPSRLYSGCWKVAGRFFSKKKCPTQAKL